MKNCHGLNEYALSCMVDHGSGSPNILLEIDRFMARLYIQGLAWVSKERFVRFGADAFLFTEFKSNEEKQ